MKSSKLKEHLTTVQSQNAEGSGVLFKIKRAHFEINGHTFQKWVCSPDEASAGGNLLHGIKNHEIRSSSSRNGDAIMFHGHDRPDVRKRWKTEKSTYTIIRRFNSVIHIQISDTSEDFYRQVLERLERSPKKVVFSCMNQLMSQMCWTRFCWVFAWE